MKTGLTKLTSIRKPNRLPRDITELMSSIKLNGVMTPIVVRRLKRKFDIIDGVRRYFAAKALGYTEVPTIVVNIVSADLQQKMANVDYDWERLIEWKLKQLATKRETVTAEDLEIMYGIKDVKCVEGKVNGIRESECLTFPLEIIHELG